MGWLRLKVAAGYTPQLAVGSAKPKRQIAAPAFESMRECLCHALQSLRPKDAPDGPLLQEKDAGDFDSAE
jgi:hypothetical protein